MLTVDVVTHTGTKIKFATRESGVGLFMETPKGNLEQINCLDGYLNFQKFTRHIRKYLIADGLISERDRLSYQNKSEGFNSIHDKQHLENREACQVITFRTDSEKYNFLTDLAKKNKCSVNFMLNMLVEERMKNEK